MQKGRWTYADRAASRALCACETAVACLEARARLAERQQPGLRSPCMLCRVPSAKGAAVMQVFSVYIVSFGCMILLLFNTITL